MAQIDPYFVTKAGQVSPQRAPMLTPELVHVGAEVWIDGIDGVFDQYLESRSVGDRLTFVVVHRGADGAVSHFALCETFQIVSARIVEISSAAIDARIRIDRVESLGQWARTVALSGSDTWQTMSRALKVDQALLTEVRDQGIWIPCPSALQHVTRAYYFCYDTAGRRRCLIMSNDHAPWCIGLC